MALVKVSSKGQLVVPKKMRMALGLKAGSVLKVQCTRKGILMEPVTESMIERLYGKFSGEDLLKEHEAEHRRESSREKRL